MKKISFLFFICLSGIHFTLSQSLPSNISIKPRNPSGLNVYKGVTSASDLFYYISSDKKNNIEVIKDNGNHQMSIKLNGDALDLAVNSKSVFALLPKEKSIDVYNIVQGNFTKITGKGDTKIKKPVGMVMNPEGNLMVLEESGLLLTFNTEGNVLKSIQLNGIVSPVSMQSDMAGNLYVLDDKLNAALKFLPDGKPLNNTRLYADASKPDDRKGNIGSFYIDPLGYAWLWNKSMNELQAFTWTDKPIKIFSAGDKDGLNLSKADDVTINPFNYEVLIRTDKKTQTFQIQVPVDAPQNLFGFDIDGEKLIVAFKNNLPGASKYGLLSQDRSGADSLVMVSAGRPFEINEMSIFQDKCRRYKLIAMNPSAKSTPTVGFDNFFGLGNYYRKKGMPDEAYAAYQNALRYMGRPAKMVQFVSLAYVDLGKELLAKNIDLIKGLNVLKTAYNINPRDQVIQRSLSQGFSNLFWRLATQENYQAIVEESGKVMSQTFLKPLLLQSLDSVADVLEKLNTISSLTNARYIRTNIVDWAPEQTAVWKNVHELDLNLFQLKQKNDAPDYELQALASEAERHILRAIDLLQKSNRPFISEYISYLRTLELGKKYAELEKNARNALQIYSNKLDANQSLNIKEYQAIGLKGIKKFDEALTAYQYLLSIRPNETKWKLQLAEITFVNNNPTEALSLYKQLLLNDRDNIELISKIGLAELAVGNAAEASIQIERALKLDPTNKNLLGPLGEAYEAINNNQKAIDQYKSAILHLNQSLKKSGSVSFKESTEKVKKYEEKLARLYTRSNLFDEASEIYKKLTRNFPENASLWFGLGQSDLSRGLVYDAVKSFQKAQSLEPQNAEYKSALQSSTELRAQISKNEDPLSITDVKLNDIYPSLYLNYSETNLLPVGSLTLTNNTNLPIRYNQISVDIPEIMKEASIMQGGVITAFSNNTIDLSAILLPKVLENNQSQKLQAKVTVNYIYEEKPKSSQRTKPFTLNPRNAINWSDKRRIASFISVGPGPMAEYANTSNSLFNSVIQVPLPDNLLKAMQLYAMLRFEKLVYTPDPDLSYYNVSSNANIIDFLQYPGETLKKKSGDCDDFVALYCSVLENIGIPTAFIDVPGHIFMAFDLNIPSTSVESMGFNPRDVIISQDKVWLPIETTLIGSAEFNDAWETAAKRYHLEINKGNFPDLIPMNEARKVYRPSLYHPAGIVGKTYETDKVIKNYKDQSFKVYARINEGSLAALKNQYLYEPYNVYIKNKYAVVLAQSGRFSEAKDILVEALRFSPNNASILNNLGNIAMQEGNIKEAVQLYEKSHSFDDSDFQTTINLVKAYIKLEDKVSARKWLEIANSIDTRFSEYYNKIINQLK